MPGFAWEAEGTVLGAGEAGAPNYRVQLLEVGLLCWAAAAIDSRGGISHGHLGQRRQLGKVRVHQVDGLEELAFLEGGCLWLVGSQHIPDTVIVRKGVGSAGGGGYGCGQCLLQVYLQSIQGCQAAVVLKEVGEK